MTKQGKPVLKGKEVEHGFPVSPSLVTACSKKVKATAQSPINKQAN